MFKTLLLISLLILQINTVHSEVYKWTDENGKTVYGDKPSSNSAEQIEIKKAPEQSNEHQQQYEKQKKLLHVMQEERDERKTLKKEEQEKKKKQKQKCTEITKELQEMKNSRALYKKTDDPDNPKFYTDKERQTEEEKYEKHLQKNCL